MINNDCPLHDTNSNIPLTLVKLTSLVPQKSALILRNSCLESIPRKDLQTEQVVRWVLGVLGVLIETLTSLASLLFFLVSVRARGGSRGGQSGHTTHVKMHR